MTIYLTGTIVYNKICNRIFKGTIINYDPEQRYYAIKYEDNDKKELSQKEVEKRIDQLNINLSSSNRHKQVEYEYWMAQQSGCRQSPQIEKLQTKYAKKWANAVNLISKNGTATSVTA